MRLRLFFAIVAIAAFAQSCAKNNYTAKPQKDIPASTSGLKLYANGDQGIYQFISGIDGKTPGVANYSTAIGNSFDLTTYTGIPFQKWKITRVNGNYYTLMNIGSGLYLQAYSYNGQQVIIQNKYTGSNAQLWDLSSLPDKSYKTINKLNGLAVTAGTDPLKQLQPFTSLPSQKWLYNELPATDTVKTASLTVTKVLTNNMVVQRNKPTNVWGTATPGAAVSVKASWNNTVFKTTAGTDSKWILAIPGVEANATPQTITISATGQPVIKLNNILIGDVWFCGGQSNMIYEMGFINGFFPGVLNTETEVAKANHPTMRYMTVGGANKAAPADDLAKSNVDWVAITPETVYKFGGVPYYFGKNLDSALHIPIGLILSAGGGSACEAWTAAETIAADPILAGYYTGRNQQSRQYNGGIYPFRNLAIKGFIWDQGESNQYDEPVSNYTRLNSAMIRQWRQLFNQGDLPFYFVQMTPTKFDKGTDDFYAFFREAQTNVRRDVVKTGMAVMMDINDITNIHYRDKKRVGDRLALLAMRNDYGLSVPAVGPSYKAHKLVQPGVIGIEFNNATALKSNGTLLQNFYVAGADKVFYKAQAAINGKNIVLTLPAQVTDVKSIRYAFKNISVSNLYNSDGLPMEPFRTDNW